MASQREKVGPYLPTMAMANDITNPASAPQTILQDVNDRGASSHDPEEPQTTEPQTTTTSSTAASVPDTASEDGAWGEQDVGGHVRQHVAMEDYEQMRRELTHLSYTQSRQSHSRSRSRSQSHVSHTQSRVSHSRSHLGRTPSRAHPNERLGLFRTITSRGRRSQSVNTGAPKEDDIENGGPTADDDDEDFQLGDFIRGGHFGKRTERGESTKKVGVLFKSLTVRGVGRKATFVKTLPEAVLGTFGPDLYRTISSYLPSIRLGGKVQTRDLIHDFTGVVRAGEMMLVLGRPGSGCSSFLKAVANNRNTFAEVMGEVSYGGMPAAEQHRHYRGEVCYNPEDDAHFPTLNVRQTLEFSLLNKTRRRAKGEIDLIVNALLKMFAITHTSKTLVGNEYVRGVSGGEVSSFLLQHFRHRLTLPSAKGYLLRKHWLPRVPLPVGITLQEVLMQVQLLTTPIR